MNYPRKPENKKQSTKSERVQRHKSQWNEKQDKKRNLISDRREYRQSLSTSQQIERLNKRLGVNIGAQKERRRLSK